MIESIAGEIASHPQEILLWTNGFFCALALRRGRIEAILDKGVEVEDDTDSKDDGT